MRGRFLGLSLGVGETACVRADTHACSVSTSCVCYCCVLVVRRAVLQREGTPMTPAQIRALQHQAPCVLLTPKSLACQGAR